MLNHAVSNKYKFKKSLNNIKYKNLSCLDIGGSGNSIKSLIKNTKILDINNGDINFDLIKDFIIKKKLPFKDKSFDIVVISQILEHVIEPIKILNETKRITKRYILISLPNDLTYTDRIKFLLGEGQGFSKFGHKQVLNYSQINSFIKENLKGFKIINTFNLFACTGGRFLPNFLKDFLAKIIPSLTCKEKFWLLERIK